MNNTAINSVSQYAQPFSSLASLRAAYRDLQQRSVDHACLLSIGLEFVNELDKLEISTSLREQFEDHGVVLSSDARVEVKQPSRNWTIDDPGRKKYTIKNTIVSLDVYDQDKDQKFIESVEDFVTRAQLTGQRLESSEDRRLAQSLIDYWADTLREVEGKRRDVTLVAFDAKAAFGLDVTQCPYPGLNTFEEKDRHLFYGRERLVRFLVNLLAQDRLLALIGPSGSGKSSLVLAGLIPALKDNALPGSQAWKYYDRMVPGSNPVANLARILEPSTVEAVIANRCNEAAVIFVDQFEELFTLCRDERKQNEFVEKLQNLVTEAPLFDIQLDSAEDMKASQVSDALRRQFREHGRELSSQAKILTNPTEGSWTILDSDTTYVLRKRSDTSETLEMCEMSKLRIILTMRSDFRSHITLFSPNFQKLFYQACILVPPLAPAELHAAIERPAHLVGLEFEPGLVVDMVSDALSGEPIPRSDTPSDSVRLRSAHAEPAPLPLLQFALHQLWHMWREREFKNPITKDDYVKLGRVYGALPKSAEKFYEDLKSEDKRKVAKHVLLRLIQPNEELEFVSRRVRYTELFEEYLFSVSLDSVSQLDAEQLSTALRKRFEEEGYVLSQDAHLKVDQPEKEWTLFEVDTQYRIRKEEDTLNVYFEDGDSPVPKSRTRTTPVWRKLNDKMLARVTGRKLYPKLRELGDEYLALEAKQAIEPVLTALDEANLVRRLYSFSVSLDFVSQLDAEQLSTALRKRFEEEGYVLSQDAHLKVDQPEKEWTLFEVDTQYRIRKEEDTLIVYDPDYQIELAHEILIDQWKVLKGWLDEKQNNLRGVRSFSDRAKNWAEGGRKGSRFDAFELTRLDELKLTGDVDFSEDLKELIKVSWTDVATKTITQWVTGALAFLLLAVLAWYAWNQKGIAERETHLAQAREWAGSAMSILDAAPELGTLLALRAVTNTYEKDSTVSPEVEASIQRAVQAVGVQRTFADHTAAVFDVAYSPDGQSLVTASADNTVRIWDTLSSAQMFTLTGHTDSVNSVAYSPDGKRLATTSADRTVRLWDAVLGTPTFTLTIGVDDVAFSPDGRYLATVSTDGTVRLLDTISQTEILSFTGYIDVGIANVMSNVISNVWSYITGSRVVTSVVGQNLGTTPLKSVAFSPDSRQLATTGVGNTVRVLDVISGAQVLTLTGHTNFVNDITFSPDGRYLATASADDSVKLWDAVSGEPIRTLKGHASEVNGVAFSPNGGWLATAGADKTVRMWDVATGAELFSLAGHENEVSTVVFSPDGLHLASASLDRTAKVWYAKPSQPVMILKGHTDWVNSVAFYPDAKRQQLATAGADRIAIVWSAINGTALLTLTGHSDSINSIAYSLDGSRLATASTDQTAMLWDVVSGRSLITLTGHSGAINSIAFSPDGAKLATASADQTARVWNSVSGTALITLTGHTGSVFYIAYSPDGTLLATGGRDGTARIWESISGRSLITLTGHSDIVNSVAFSPDGRRLATASADKSARVWDVGSGKELLSPFGHASGVSRIVFSPDGTRLATADMDGTVRIWDATSGQELYTLSGHIGAVRDLKYSPDGRYLASTGNDQMIRIYALSIDDLLKLARARVTRPLTPKECREYLHLHEEECQAAP